MQASQRDISYFIQNKDEEKKKNIEVLVARCKPNTNKTCKNAQEINTAMDNFDVRIQLKDDEKLKSLERVRWWYDKLDFSNLDNKFVIKHNSLDLSIYEHQETQRYNLFGSNNVTKAYSSKIYELKEGKLDRNALYKFPNGDIRQVFYSASFEFNFPVVFKTKYMYNIIDVFSYVGGLATVIKAILV